MSDEDQTQVARPPHLICPPLNIFPPGVPRHRYDSNLSYFTSIPWCARLLRHSIPFISQSLNPATSRQDQFMGATLTSNPRGLKHMISFFRPCDEHHLRNPGRVIDCVHTLFSLGEGLSGYSDICHGGVIMTMADEATSYLHEINTALGKDGLVYQGTTLTAQMQVNFLRPVSVPSVVCVTAWNETTEGRKSRLRCAIKGSEGQVLAEGTSLWVALKPKI